MIPSIVHPGIYNEMCTNVVKLIDIEELGTRLDAAINARFDEPDLESALAYKDLIHDILTTKDPLDILKRKHKCCAKNCYIYKCYKLLHLEGSGSEHETIRRRLKVKKGKTQSGIVSITIFTSAYPSYKKDGKLRTNNFSCKWDCAYCPNEPGQPRSYLKGEPGVLRANRNEFDCVRQMYDRMTALYNNGHDMDKLEVLVLGGTWESYPEEYRTEFIRDMYYAANTFSSTVDRCRDRFRLEHERDSNRHAKCKVIGLTLETRPDTICPKALQLFRHYGCTRVQIGIQHLDDDILRRINRGCMTKDAIEAIKLLKNNGFKVDAHWMPNLPGSDVSKDEEMFIGVLLNVLRKKYNKNTGDELWELKHPEFQVDQWKIYPCTVVPFTKIEEWYKSNTYVPYSWDSQTNLILKVKSLIFPWIRLNRIVRDIPGTYSLNSDYDSSLRSGLPEILQRDGLRCNCIRCREVKDREFNNDYKIISREFNASDGTEMFIEAQYNGILYGFLRLRYNPGNNTVFPELNGCSMIRELHVYGNLSPVGTREVSNTQHKGIGRALIAKAERITIDIFTLNKISVIPGEGTREYYTKHGFVNDHKSGRYMIKELI
jgi:ELP3 family radical SAM enzyme/protein acetyltransferase